MYWFCVVRTGNNECSFIRNFLVLWSVIYPLPIGMRGVFIFKGARNLYEKTCVRILAMNDFAKGTCYCVADFLLAFLRGALCANVHLIPSITYTLASLTDEG